jgi:hypothetical protein
MEQLMNTKTAKRERHLLSKETGELAKVDLLKEEIRLLEQ